MIDKQYGFKRTRVKRSNIPRVLTVGQWRLPTGHQTITQLDYLGHSNDALAVVSLVRQQHQEPEHGGDQLFSLSVNGWVHVDWNLVAQREKPEKKAHLNAGSLKEK
ncbi:hypothetical protein E2C01_032425 [Portunus trituberculatus]|uniref:Uncharacterized protein n=1 Tax=Portunus trituberculatus TaxID=210409 RepID=A0A5B7F083_PORTR|nr:hypothetical protein [Portunus trituberculatus]